LPGKLETFRPESLETLLRIHWKLISGTPGNFGPESAPANQVAVVATHTANYQRFQALVEQYAQQVVEQTRVERATNAKKKTRRATSSWPKSRKSNS